jgi:hypothetical protein
LIIIFSDTIIRIEHFLNNIVGKLSDDGNNRVLILAAEKCHCTARALFWYEKYVMVDANSSLHQYMPVLQVGAFYSCNDYV